MCQVSTYTKQKNSLSQKPKNGKNGETAMRLSPQKQQEGGLVINVG